MSKTTIQFDLIKYGDNGYCVDPNSFTMYGSISIDYLTDFFADVDNWASEVWKDLASQDENCREVTMNVFIDSDDFRSWLDFDVLPDFPNDETEADLTAKLKLAVEALEHYGNPDTYSDGFHKFGCDAPNIASDALKQIGEQR